VLVPRLSRYGDPDADRAGRRRDRPARAVPRDRTDGSVRLPADRAGVGRTKRNRVCVRAGAANLPALSRQGRAVDCNYSYFNALIGSTRDARCAGIKPAHSATRARATAESASTAGSAPVIWKRIDCAHLPTPSAPARPTSVPTSVMIAT